MARRWAVLLLVWLMPVAALHAQNIDGFLADTRAASDVDFLTRLLQDSLSDRGRAVTITGFRGALSSRATFTEMTIADDAGVWLRISDAALQWNRAALLERRIEISEITAARVEILRMPQAEPDDALVPVRRFELPELPVAIRLDRLALGEVRVDASVLGQSLRAGISGAASLAAGEGQAELAVSRLDDIAGEFQIAAAFSNQTRNLTLDLTLTEDAGGLAVSLLGVPEKPSARLAIQGDGPIEAFDATIALATGGQDRVTGTFMLQTGLPGVTQAVRLDLSGDIRPLMAAAYHPFFGETSRLRAQARRFEDGRLSLDDLSIQTSNLRVDGRARLGVARLPELIDLRVRVRDPADARVILPVRGGQTSIQRAEMLLSFDASQSEDWDLTVDALGFRNESLAIETLFMNGLGRISQQGFGEDIDVVDALVDFSALGIDVNDPALAQALGRQISGSIAVIWREGAPLLLPGLIIEGRDYTLQGRARLEDGVIRGDGRAEFLDLARLSALAGRDLGGAVTLDWAGQIGPERDDFTLEADISGQDLTVSQAQIDRLLAGTSRVQARLSGDEGVISLHELSTRAQTLRAALSGTLSPETVSIAGDLNFADMSVLDPALGGALQAQIAVQGETGREQVRIDGTLRDLRAGAVEIGRLMAGTTTLRLTGQRAGQALDLAELQLENAALRATLAGRLALGGSDLRLDARLSDLARLRPELGGALSMRAQITEQGQTRRADLALNATGLRTGQAALDALLSGGLELGARIVHEPGSLLVQTARLTGGAVSAEITGQMQDGRPDMRVQARLSDISTLAPGITGAASVTGQVRDRGPDFALDLAISGPAGLSTRVQGRLGRDLRADLRATGQVDIALINPRIEPRSVQGVATFSAAVTGPLALSSVTGQATLGNGQLVIPERYITAAGITGTAALAGGQVRVNLSGDLGTGGSATLGGTVALAPQIAGDLTLDLRRARLVQPRLFETRTSGQLRITGALARGPSIAGTLTLDDTEIRIPRVGLVSRGYIPPDIVHLGESAEARATRERAGIFRGESHGRTRWPASLDITLNAPARIFVRGRGLDAELGGSLRLTGTTTALVPIGQFGLIRGRVDVLGNRFTLNEGFANLQGDLIPFVRLVASTERNGVIARVVLEGRADNPLIRFESVPVLPEEEVVSLLLFGRGLQTLSVFQAAQLASSLATLSGRSEGVMEKLRRTVGVDDLDLRTDEDGETSLRIGRYLTRNVYTDIEVKPRGASEVSINIDLTPALTARARVDNAGRSGIGLFFERDY